jgi:hypothetical protein
MAQKGQEKFMKSRKSISPGSQISDFRFRFQDGPATGNTLALSVEYQSIIQIASMAQSRLGMHSKNRKDGGLHDASRGMTSAD